MLFPDRDLIPEKKKKRSYKLIILGIFLGFLLGQGSGFLVQRLWIFPYTVNSEYMEPGLKKGNSLYINRWADPSSFRHGDVILIHHPENSEWHLLRRVAGIPGDTIEIQNRIVIVNGQKFSYKNEASIQSFWNGKSPLKYTEFSGNDQMKPITLKDNELFVLADNRRIALDSRHFGPITFKNAIGIATEP